MDLAADQLHEVVLGASPIQGRDEVENPHAPRLGVKALSGLLNRFSKGVPGEGGALDAYRELHHTLQGFEVAERHLGHK